MPQRLNKLVWMVCAAVALSAGPALASEGGGPDFYGGIGQAIVTIFIFGVLVLVLGKWAWKPLVAQLEKRERSIAQAIADSQNRQKEAEELLARYKARLDAAQAEAAEVLAEARRTAAEARELVLAGAQQESRKLTDDARQEIGLAKIEAIGELHEATAGLAADIAAQVIGRHMTSEDHRRLLNDSLEEIRQRAAR